jgi:hypothetical protein
MHVRACASRCQLTSDVGRWTDTCRHELKVSCAVQKELCRRIYHTLALSRSRSRFLSLCRRIYHTLSIALALSRSSSLSLSVCLFVCLSLAMHTPVGNMFGVYVPPVCGRVYLSRTHALTQALSRSLILFLRACLPLSVSLCLSLAMHTPVGSILGVYVPPFC